MNCKRIVLLFLYLVFFVFVYENFQTPFKQLYHDIYNETIYFNFTCDNNSFLHSHEEVEYEKSLIYILEDENESIYYPRGLSDFKMHTFSFNYALNNTVDDLCLSLYQHMNEFKINKASLVSSGLNGYIAVVFARMFPRRVNSIIIQDLVSILPSMSRFDAFYWNIKCRYFNNQIKLNECGFIGINFPYVYWNMPLYNDLFVLHSNKIMLHLFYSRFISGENVRHGMIVKEKFGFKVYTNKRLDLEFHNFEKNDINMLNADVTFKQWDVESLHTSLVGVNDFDAQYLNL